MHFDPAVLVVLPVVVLSLVVHECAHALVAFWRGDGTARERGRLTLGPLPHLDPLGTLVVPVLLIVFHAPVGFGWARPVPVDSARLRNPRDDRPLVALAVPIANLMLALGFAAVARVAPEAGFWSPLGTMARAGVAWNCSLALLNLIPIPPLDGAFLLMRVLPLRHIIVLHHFRVVGLALVVAVLFTPWVANAVVHAPVRLAVGACLALFGVGTEPAT